MEKHMKNSLLLFTLLMILILSISATFAQDLDDSTADLAVYNDDDSISVENQDIGYELSSANDDISTDTVSAIDDDIYDTDSQDIVSAENDEQKLSAGETTAPMPELDTGVVSGGVDYIASNPASASSNIVYTVPEGITNVKSAIVIVNIYSGSGAGTYGLYSNVTLNTKNGLEELGYETLLLERDCANDPAVYVINDHATKQYSDYQMVYDITNKVNTLSSGDSITVNVANSKHPDKLFDGRIKLLSLFFAYDDGDNDNYTYWLNVGQLWTQDTESFDFNTQAYTGKTNNISLRTIALSSSLASLYKINNAEVNYDSSTDGGLTYKDIKWDNIGPKFNAGSKTNFWAQNGGGSYKTNIALLVASEPETVEPLTEVYVDYANGNDENLGTALNTAFKTFEHALSVIEPNGIIYMNGIYYLDDVDVNGLSIDKDITIIGLGDGATIDANNNGRIFHIGANTVSLSNLALINANVTSASDKRGGAIWAQGSTLTVDNCKFINNTAGASSSYGGAINLKSTSATIKDSYFENNSAFYTGAGINAESSNLLLNVSNCIFTLNEVLNTGWANGGAICSYGTVIINGSAFYGNKLAEGKNGRSINQYGNTGLTLTNSILLDGDLSVYVAGGSTNLENNWWGNNDSSADSNPKDLGYTNVDVNSYLYLNMTGFASGMEVGDTASININLVPTGDGTVNLMNLPATLTAVNGNIVPTETELVNGACTATYTITTAGDNTITVNVLGIEDTLSLSSGDVISTEVIYVNATGGSDSNSGVSWASAFQTIEKAISTVDDNGIIYVADGFYPLADSTSTNGISISKNIAIVGESVNAIISGGNTKRIFTIGVGHTLNITNLTLTEGKSNSIGGAIQIEDGGNTNPVTQGYLILTDSIISNSNANYGGAIGSNRAAVDNINNVTFINNHASSGGVIYVQQKGTLTIGDNNKFINNSANGRASALYAQATVTTGKNNLFYGNVATGNYGYGAICSYGFQIGPANVFVNNKATAGGALYLAGNRYSGSGSYVIFINNTDNNGRPIGKQSNSQSLTLNNCYWGTNEPNFSTVSNGGVTASTYLILGVSADPSSIRVGDTSTITVDLTKNQNGTTVDINSLPAVLPLMFTVENGNVNPVETELVNGIGTTTYSPAVMGEGSVTVNIYAPLETITFNVGAEAGTVFVNSTGGLDTNAGDSWDSAVKTLSHAFEIVGAGKTIYMADGTYTLDGASADGLTIDKDLSIVGMGDNVVIDANNNGRIFKIGANTVDLSNLAFINGNASTTTEKRGGALYVDGATLSIDNCKFINNTAGTRADAGDTSTYAGAINLKSSTTTITNSEFDGNTAWSTGAGINVENTNILLNISDSTFTNNVILNNGWSAGAAICAYNTVIIDRSVFSGNRLTDETRNGKTINEYGTGSLTITNSILLDGEKGVWIATGPTTLENNWWGNNDATAETNPKDLGYTNADVGSYLVLSSSINAENIYQGDIITVTTTLNGNVIELPIALSANAGIITPAEATIISSEASAYNATVLGNVEITVDVMGIQNVISFTVKETLPDVAISNVKTPWADGIYPGVNNTFNITLTNNGENAVEGLVLEVYSNETGELIASYTFESIASGTSSILITDPAIRAITEDTIWPAAQNNKIKFTFNLMRGDDLVSTVSVDKILAYNGYLNKTYAYGGHDNIINRNYTITGDLIIATQDVSVYMDQYSRFRNESWNIETPEGAEIVKVFLYFNYNWDTSFFPNGWTLTFNDADILNEYISYETDRGNLGTWGAYNYGLMVFDVTDYYNVNEINNFVIEKTGNCALYPSTLYVLYNQTGSDSYKDIYFSDICDVYYPNYNMNGYDELLKTVVNYNGINVDNLADATWYVFSGSSSVNNNISFNEGLVVNPFNGYTSNDCRPYAYNVSGLIGTDNEAWFITGSGSTTTVAYEQVLVVERMKDKPSISVANNTVNLDIGEEFDIGAALIPNVGELTYTSSDESIAIVEDGKITAIAPGEAIITISFAGNEEYRSSNATVTVTVNKMSGAQLSASVEEYPVTQTGALAITVTDVDGNALNGSAYVEIDGEIYAVDLEVIDGQATVDLTDLAVGQHVAKVIFENPMYLSVDYTTHFTVSKAIPVITVSGDEIELEDIATVNVTVMDGETPVSGYAIVTVNGVNYAVTIGNDGKGFVDIENLPFGEYPITAKFLGNDNYEAADYTGNAKVVVTSDEITFDLAVNDDKTEIIISNAKDAAGEDIDGYIFGELFKDGQKVQDLDFAMLEEGTGTINIPEGLLPGEYTAMITIMSDDDAFASDEISFTIEAKLGVQVNANAEEYPVTQTGTLAITVTDIDGNALNGTAYVEIDGEIYAVDLEVIDGQTNVDLSDLAIGEHVAKVIFENPNYLTVDYTTHFNVTKASTASLTVAADSIKEGETATVNVTLNAGDEKLSGTVIVTVDGVNYAVEIADGTGSVDIKNLPANTYDITAKFIGNDDYDETTATGSFTVSPYTKVTVDVVADADNIVVSLTDSEGNPVSGTVNVTIDGTTEAKEVGENGKLVIPVEDGSHEVTVDYPGDETHPATSISQTVVTAKDIKDTVIALEAADVEYGQDVIVKVTLTDSNGIGISGVVNVTIGDQSKEVTVTDGEGSEIFSDVNAGKYTIIGEFAGNNAYAATVGFAKTEVTKLATVINYEDMTTTAVDVDTDGRVGENFTITLKDSNGKALANKAVQFGFNGKIYDKVTDENGVAVLQINLRRADIYTFAVSFIGDDAYNGSFAVAKITVNKQTGSLTVPNKSYKASASTKTLIATFKSASGKVVADKKVSFTVNGKTYTATTDAKGVASVKVSLSNKKTYSFTAKFAGDNTYAAITKTAKVTIN